MYNFEFDCCIGEEVYKPGCLDPVNTNLVVNKGIQHYNVVAGYIIRPCGLNSFFAR